MGAYQNHQKLEPGVQLQIEETHVRVCKGLTTPGYSPIDQTISNPELVKTEKRNPEPCQIWNILTGKCFALPSLEFSQ